MARCKLWSILVILLLSELEWNVTISYHVLNLVPTQESRHEDEVEKQEWPVDLQVGGLEAAKEGRHGRRTHHLAPKVHLLQLALESFVL